MLANPGTERSAQPSPQAEYERRQALRRDDLQIHQRRESMAGYGRVLAFLAILAALYAMYHAGQVRPLWLVPAVAAFIAAVAWHRRVVRELDRARRAIAYYATALSRLDDRWAGTGPDGQRYSHREHPYATDLDLFGRGSLFQLLCAARTRMGQDTLAAWLLEPADPQTIRARQTAIEELRGKLDLREELAVLEALGSSELHPQTLRTWVAAPPLLGDRLRPVLAAILAPVSVATLVGWLLFGMEMGWFLAVAVLQGLLLASMRRQIRELTRHVDATLKELNLLVQVLKILEVQGFASPRLRDLVERLHADGGQPSRRIAGLARLVDHWEIVLRNQFVAPFGFVLMLVVYLAYAMERWRRKHGQAVLLWLEAVGEFEALCSLSGYAYEHSEQPFPEILATGPCLEGKDLGHPLIPSRRRVTNDLELGGPRQLFLVSGSNMSGKSTLLRTVGLNAVLALAGGPVCAARLRVSPLAVASAMRLADSLQEGVSAFYAEIQRLRGICDRAAGRPAVLFLLDEILHGTNSHDRRAGAEAIIENLLKQGAVGLITTHDLALAEIADRLAPRAANVHFEDQLVEGRLSFDYRLRPGVVPKGNGLVLMRLLGFEV